MLVAEFPWVTTTHNGLLLDLIKNFVDRMEAFEKDIQQLVPPLNLLFGDGSYPSRLRDKFAGAIAARRVKASYRKLALTAFFTISLLILVTLQVAYPSRIMSSVATAPSSTLFFSSARRHLLVIPYCSLANRLTLMIESLSISAESSRNTILNWISTESEQALFADLFDVSRSPFGSIYENADLPERINPATFSRALVESQRPLILSEQDIPWLSSTVLNQPKTFYVRQKNFLKKRLWNRNYDLRGGGGGNSGGSGMGRGLIYAGCHNLSPDDLEFLKEFWPEDTKVSVSRYHTKRIHL